MKFHRENLEFVTGGSAPVGGGSGIQRSASAAVISQGSSSVSLQCMPKCDVERGKNRTPRGISKYPGAPQWEHQPTKPVISLDDRQIRDVQYPQGKRFVTIWNRGIPWLGDLD